MWSVDNMSEAKATIVHVSLYDVTIRLKDILISSMKLLYQNV